MERIAKIHPTATLSPTKDEILHQQFGPVTSIGAFRFVDPNGKVGIETLLVQETTNDPTAKPHLMKSTAPAPPG